MKNCSEICKKCGGACCKRYPGATIPSQWGKNDKEILENLIEAFKSKKWAIDWYENDPRRGKDEMGEFYFVRPADKLYGDIFLFCPLWEGECIFLTPEGCSLPEEKRPLECIALIPRENWRCVPYFTKKEASILWIPYKDIILEAAKRSGRFEERAKTEDLFWETGGFLSALI